MSKAESRRRTRRAGWLAGIVVVACACSGDDTLQTASGQTASAGTTGLGVGPGVAGVGAVVAGTGAGGSVAPAMPGMNFMGSAGMQILPPSAAGTGGVAGAGGVAASAGNSGSGAGGHAGAGLGGSSGSAGAAGSAGAMSPPTGGDITAVCAGGKMGMDSTTAKTSGVTEYAAVKYLATGGNQILSLKTTLQVPNPPTEKQVLFIWPGLQCNNGKDPGRIGNGILQPVLTWGPSCAPKQPTSGYASWWMSAMYVNVSTAAAGPSGCAGGDFMPVAVGDLLQIDMSLTDKGWTQTVLDQQSMKKVDYTIDLKGQVQNWATWAIEVPQGETLMPKDEVIYTQSVLTFSTPVTSCQPNQRGPNDYFSAPILSTDGKNCCYDKIILRAKGTPAM